MSDSYRILVVEDNELNLKLVRDVLSYAGYQVMEARSGEQGVELAAECRPDLILMDLQLPGIDGTETLRQLRASPLTQEVPVVAVTAFAMREDRERAVRSRGSTDTSRSRSASASSRRRCAASCRAAAMDDEATILVVDDQPPNIRLLDAVLSPRGYRVLTAASGEEALDVLREEAPHVVLLDIMMPGMDGYEVCRRIREHPETAYLPIVMITASDTQEKVRAIEAGADDFVTKPFDQAELLARVKSLVRIKRYQDTIRRQAAELEAWNRQLEERVESQVAALDRATRLRRFLSPQMAELIIDSGDESILESHRREIVVVFCDLRQFTAFAESSEPEELMAVLSEYHGALGDLVFRYEGTLERFTGDGLMVVFNDPMPCEDAGLRAIRMAVAMRTRVRDLAESWSRHGHDLAFGVGVAQGYATLGRIGFEGRVEYTAIGTVVNLAARLCAVAKPWQILVTPACAQRRRGPRRPLAGRRPGAERLQPARARLRRQGSRHRPGPLVSDHRRRVRAGRTWSTCRRSTRSSATSASTASSATCRVCGTPCA